MDRKKYRMVGIRIYNQGIVACMFKFYGDITTQDLIETLSDDGFNEYVWQRDIENELDRLGIAYMLAKTDSVDGGYTYQYTEKRQDAVNRTFDVASHFDIYIDIENYSDDRDVNPSKMMQYVYVYSAEWDEAKAVYHVAGRDAGTDMFWDESRVSVIKGINSRTQPVFWSECREAVQDEKRCVPFYDTQVILAHISDIGNCDDLRDYAEDETREKSVRMGREMEP